mgnify:CR=1 FL=1
MNIWVVDINNPKFLFKPLRVRGKKMKELFNFENFRIVCFIGYWIFAFLTFYLVYIEDPDQASFSLRITGLFGLCYGIVKISEYSPVELRKFTNDTSTLLGNIGKSACLAGLIILIIIGTRKR